MWLWLSSPDPHSLDQGLFDDHGNGVDRFRAQRAGHKQVKLFVRNRRQRGQLGSCRSVLRGIITPFRHVMRRKKNLWQHFPRGRIIHPRLNISRG